MRLTIASRFSSVVEVVSPCRCLPALSWRHVVRLTRRIHAIDSVRAPLQLSVRLCVSTDRRCARIKAAHQKHAEKERMVSWGARLSPGHTALPWPRGRRSRWTWQRLCALALCTTAPLLYLLASICLATGVFHHETPHQAHHPHTSPHAHDPSGLLDVCDFAQQALTTTVVAPVPLLPCLLPPGESLPRPLGFVLPIELASRHGIRAPPRVHA